MYEKFENSLNEFYSLSSKIKKRHRKDIKNQEQRGGGAKKGKDFLFMCQQNYNKKK